MTNLAKRRSNPKSISKVRPHSLKSGRPPLSHHGQQPTLSSRATRNLIRGHHTLLKRLSAARTAKDEKLTAELEAQVAANGGLQSYQLASTLGQSDSRGGDTSRVLVEWLDLSRQSAEKAERANQDEYDHQLRVLEVGALSTSNALNVPRIDVRRIDLRSQAVGIEEINFMELPLPLPLEKAGYDILSLSLVVNFVPDARSRGEMLKQTTKFLRTKLPDTEANQGQVTSPGNHHHDDLLPALFLVLPLPCVSNSRYLDEPRLTAMMMSLNYTLARVKRSSKLFYSLWTYRPPDRTKTDNRSKMKKGMTEEGSKKESYDQHQTFKKEELRGGKERNNFCIVLD